MGVPGTGVFVPCSGPGWTHHAELGPRAQLHPKGAGDAPTCPLRQAVLSKDAGSGSAASDPPPQLSVIKISILSVQPGAGRVLPNPWARAGCQCGSGNTAGNLLRGAPQHRLLPQHLPRSLAGETEAQAALGAGMVVKSEPGAHSHCKLDTLSFSFFFTGCFVLFFFPHV